MPRALSHIEVFFAANGFGPYPCVFCGKLIDGRPDAIHHIDEDQSNDDPLNLGAAHHGGHSTYHNEGRERLDIRGDRNPMRRPEIRERVAASLRGKKRPDTTERNRTRVRSPIELENIRKAARSKKGREDRRKAGLASAAARKLKRS